MSTSLRASLQALAQGTSPQHDADAVDAAFIAEHADAFSAWSHFASNAGEGEPIPAPADLLIPLP